MKRAAIIGSTAAMLAFVSAPAFAQVDTALGVSDQTARDTAASQRRIDQLDDQTASLLNDYRAALKQWESVKRYNESMRNNIAAQEAEIERLQEDIANIDELTSSVQPLMMDMVERFEQIVAADIPFQQADRGERVDRLKAILNNPSMSAAQRYRLIVEAYQIENEFGRTIGAYNGILDVDGEAITGEFLQIGRVALVFKTEDDSVLRIYNNNTRAWEPLNRGTYLQDVKFGLRMAKEQTAPDIMFVPVRAPETVQAQ